MRWKSIIFCVALCGFASCKDKKKELILGKPDGPSIEGTWAGDLTVNDKTSQVQLDLTQTDVSFKGTYRVTGGDDISDVLSSTGRIDGVTSGPGFSFKFFPENHPCDKTIQAGGENSGDGLSFNMTSTSCAGETLRGQASLAKK